MVRISSSPVISAVVALLACSVASGEVFVLHNGGRVEGEILNPDESPRVAYTIKTSLGGQVTLPADEVKEVIYRRPEEVEYEKIRPSYPDTVEGQWELAEWCREHTLLSQRQEHLSRIIELDPNHEKARRVLGYSRVGDQWMTQEQRMLNDGYRRYKGRWMLPQEIELLEQEREKEVAEGAWKGKLSLWRQWLGTDKFQEAQQNIRIIDDPNAIKALELALHEDKRDQARLLYVEALARIGTARANRALATRALKDPVEEVRLTCLDYLKEKKAPESVDYFIGRLQSSDNTEIKLAAVALRHLGDTAAVSPLIDALVSTHKYKVTTGNPGQMTTTFSNAGPAGLTLGGGTKIVTQQVRNRAVLDALVTLTGVNFGFDIPRWKSWYTSQVVRPALDARRD